MDLNQLKKIIEIFESSTLSELEIEEGETRFKLAKEREKRSVIPGKKEVSFFEDRKIKEKREEEEKRKKLFSVKSPLVGTFYRSPSPEEEPFVEVGDRVTAGQPLCIIEAMKVMNEITSEVPGRIKEIMVENGHPVEYDQELFLIEEEK